MNTFINEVSGSVGTTNGVAGVVNPLPPSVVNVEPTDAVNATNDPGPDVDEAVVV